MLAGLACDVSVDGRASLFKSALLGQLAAADWRVGALVRLVKAWAREQGINSAGDGTLSSHALTLMVSRVCCQRQGNLGRQGCA